MINSPVTTLASGIDTTQTTITVIDGNKIPAAPNLATLGGGESTETILYTGKTGNTLTGVTRGFQGTAKAWTTGTQIGRFFTAYDHDTFLNNINSIQAMPTAEMSRQAIINGNFDIWQRGTTATNPAHNTYPAADRWKVLVDGSGFPSSIVHSRQALTPGDIPGAYYFYRVAPNGAGTTPDLYRLIQGIEHGTRYLCGVGKKVTISFWARSSIANKRIGVYLIQGYGTGGSPSAAENINGYTWTLTNEWKKYTATFTTNTLTGKTFGSNNDDTLSILFGYAWNTAFMGRLGASTAENFVGAGNIDIAQVQLCAGDVDVPFQPRSFTDELVLCQRYYEKSYNYNVRPGTVDPAGMITTYASEGYIIADGGAFKVGKRITPTMAVYSPYSGAISKARRFGDSSDVAVDGFEHTSTNHAGRIYYGAGTAIPGMYQFHWTADAEL